MEEEDIKLEVLKCFRTEVVGIRDEMRAMGKEFVGIKIVSENSAKEIKETRRDQISTNNDVLTLTIHHQELERRHVQHNNRLDTKIDSTYKDLRTDLRNMTLGIEKFQKEVQKQITEIGKIIAKWGGRDSILKLLFGGILGGGLVALIGVIIKAVGE